MAESQTTPASISLDNEGRIVITAPQLSEALKGAEASLRARPLPASNNVVQCGCNLVAGCG
jgi:hypothetical protein